MRVRIVYNQTPAPCGDTNYGEVEDYTISVISNIPSHVTVSGYIRTTGTYGLKDVLISANTGESTTTDIYGYYAFTFATPWTGTITPTKEKWAFSPTSESYTGIISNLSNVNFAATASSMLYWGGSGTETSPYLIRYPVHLQELGSNPADWNKHFKLVDYISLSDYTGEQFNMIGVYTWGVADIPFTGVFDGDGYTIGRFSYTYSSTPQKHIGIFSYINGADAEVKNLTVNHFEIDGGAQGVGEGALVGFLDLGTISNCSAEDGTVTGQFFTSGGLIGNVLGGTVTNCYASAEVSCSDGQAGGLVGSNSGTITDCTSECDVTGKYNVGGLVGTNNGAGNILYCFSAGNTSGQQQVGGLAGENNGFIVESFSQGTVAGTTTEAGGLVGRNVAGGKIYNSYSTASVSGGGNCGGLVGLQWETGSIPTTILNCYATGAVSGTFPRGGLVGKNLSGTVTNSFWDSDIGGPDNGIGTPKTTSQMKTISTFTDAGWDFVEETANGTEDIWIILEHLDYPRLASQSLLHVKMDLDTKKRDEIYPALC